MKEPYNHTSGEVASYRCVNAYASAEIIEKKSRFIAEIFPVKDEAEAQALIGKTEKKYYDARHHCYAFVCGIRSELMRSSDNGEPSGTAGRPILEVITGNGLTDTLIIVTRYFGGTLLGTGGLVRAYTQAAQAALAAAQIKTMVYGQTLSVRVDYPLSGTLERYIRDHGIDCDTPVYEADVRYGLFLPVAHVDQVINDLTNICNGNIDISPGEHCYR